MHDSPICLKGMHAGHAPVQNKQSSQSAWQPFLQEVLVPLQEEWQEEQLDSQLPHPPAQMSGLQTSPNPMSQQQLGQQMSQAMSQASQPKSHVANTPSQTPSHTKVAAPHKAPQVTSVTPQANTHVSIIAWFEHSSAMASGGVINEAAAHAAKDRIALHFLRRFMLFSLEIETQQSSDGSYPNEREPMRPI